MRKSEVFALILLGQLLCSNLFAQLEPPGGGDGCTNCPPYTNIYFPAPYVPGLKVSIPPFSGTNLPINLLEADPAGTYDIYTASNLVASAWNDVLQGTNGQTNFTLPFPFTQMGFFRAARTDTPVMNTASMTVYFPNNNVNTNLTSAIISGGPAAAMAVLVNDTNLADAVWIPFSAVPYVLLGTNDGTYQVEFGFIGSDGQVNWTSTSVTLDTTPPALFITSPSNNVVTQPVIQLTGYSPEALASISYDITNAAGLVTNQQVLVLDQFYDTNSLKFTTNAFQAFDIPLTNGLNNITIHATDLAGNTTTLTTNFTLDYSSKTNPPVLNVNWPQVGVKICGSNFTCNGSVSDPTVLITVQLVDANSNTNILNAVVGRAGDFWAEGLPLNGGTNYLTLTTTDAAGNTSTTNLIVVQGDVGLGIDPVSAGQTTVTGEINSSDYTIWVNGAAATNNGDGTWAAQIAPIRANGDTVEAMAIPNSDNGGYGSAAQADSFGNPKSTQAQGVQAQAEAPSGVFISSYQENDEEDYVEMGGSPDNPYYHLAYSDVNFTHWTDGKSSRGQRSFHDDPLIPVLYKYAWPATTWPQSLTNGAGTEIYLTYGITNLFVCNPPSLQKEHCKISQNDTNGWPQGYQRTADTKIKLATGGKPGSRRMNLWLISATATEYLPPWLNYPLASTNIDPKRISVFGNTLRSDGTMYVLLPDNAKPDATPVITGAPNYYSFNVTAQKYLSYFDLYVEQANPGYSFLPYGPNYVGHASWKLSTEAPSDALQYISTNLTAYLNHTWGVFPGPSGSICSDNPGQLESDGANNGANIHRKFYISFSGLLNGLSVTRGMKLAPPAYCVTGFNCNSAARYAGYASGVHSLPDDQSPQNFGVTLIGMYPPILSSDPFEDDVDIFQSQSLW